MIYIGVGLISFAALFLSHEYCEYLKKRFSECEGFLLFIKHLRLEVSCFLKQPSELCRGFENEALSRAGFLPALSEGASLADSFLGCEGALSLSAQELDAVREFCTGIGLGYLDESLRLADTAEAKLGGLCARLSEELPKKKKLSAVLAASAALGLIILVI